MKDEQSLVKSQIGGSNELEICLIIFTNRLKVEEQGRNTWVFKAKIRLKIVGS